MPVVVAVDIMPAVVPVGNELVNPIQSDDESEDINFEAIPSLNFKVI